MAKELSVTIEIKVTIRKDGFGDGECTKRAEELKAGIKEYADLKTSVMWMDHFAKVKGLELDLNIK